jgi:hypothetical protein
MDRAKEWLSRCSIARLSLSLLDIDMLLLRFIKIPYRKGLQVRHNKMLRLRRQWKKPLHGMQGLLICVSAGVV